MKIFSLLSYSACVAATNAKQHSVTQITPNTHNLRSAVGQEQAKEETEEKLSASKRSLSFRNDNPIIEGAILKHVGDMRKKAIESGHKHLDRIHKSYSDEGSRARPQNRRKMKKAKSSKMNSGSYSAKSDKSGGSYSKSYKDDDSGGYSKSSKEGYSGYSKSSKDGYSGYSKSNKSGNGGCEVTVTNLSYEQSISEMFVMVHSEDLMDEEGGPLFEFGSPAHTDIAKLAQDMDTSDLLAEYQDRDGVQESKVVGYGDDVYLYGGGHQNFTIEPSRYNSRLTLAAGLPFANDAIVPLSNALIEDGAVYYLEVVDTGVEQNLQLCWTVAALKVDFPDGTDCFAGDADTVDTNDDNFIGEGFVHIHRGMHRFAGEDDLDALKLKACTDDQKLFDTGYAEYFVEANYDDQDLLCETIIDVDTPCTFRNDDDFAIFLNTTNIENKDYQGALFAFVRESDDFEDFCDKVQESTEFVDAVFTFLEPEVFDFRNPMVKVEINC